MNKTIIIYSLFFSLLSCHSKNSIVQFRALDENLRKGNKFIKQANNGIYDQIDDKSKDPQTRRAAVLWQPRALAIKKLSAGMNDYIDSLKYDIKKNANLVIDKGKESYDETDTKPVDRLFGEKGKTPELVNKLIVFKQAIVAAINPGEFSDNPVLQKDLMSKSNEFENSLMTDLKPAKPGSGTSQVAAYFQNTSTLGAVTMLDKIQDDVLNAESQEIEYLNSITTVDYEGFMAYSALVNQNSTYLKTGEQLEISAGVGAFLLRAKVKVTIDGNEIPLNREGIAAFTLPVHKKPGKYFIPVKINFRLPDGSRSVSEKAVEYTVRD